MRNDSLNVVWSYRQATQDMRNIERLAVWKWKCHRRQQWLILQYGLSQAKPSPEYLRYQMEAMRPVVTHYDVANMVKRDERRALESEK